MFCSYTVLAIDRQMSLLWIGLAALAVNIGINLALIPSLSYEASAIATLATEAAALTLMAVVIASDLRFLPSLRTMARIAVPLSIAAAIAAFLFNGSIPVQAAIVAGGIGVSYGFSGAISVRDLRALLERDSNPSQLGNEMGAGT
jgi:O-antigen/teichoic acid export membrane protein